jgi:hypothetical protein
MSELKNSIIILQYTSNEHPFTSGLSNEMSLERHQAKTLLNLINIISRPYPRSSKPFIRWSSCRLPYFDRNV